MGDQQAIAEALVGLRHVYRQLVLFSGESRNFVEEDLAERREARKDLRQANAVM